MQQHFRPWKLHTFRLFPFATALLPLQLRSEMFNSPASRLTPRRNPGKPRESLAPSSRAQSVFSESLAAPTPRSRLAVSRVPPSPTPTIAETLRTVREVDGFERVTWSKDCWHEVYSAGGLPKEVQKLLKASDFVDDIVGGHIDPVSGFAFVATPRECIAWNYQKVRRSLATGLAKLTCSGHTLRQHATTSPLPNRSTALAGCQLLHRSFPRPTPQNQESSLSVRRGRSGSGRA
jgi:nuclear pore complex protein Nup133